jgi:hypothetical protein
MQKMVDQFVIIVVNTLINQKIAWLSLKDSNIIKV